MSNTKDIIYREPVPEDAEKIVDFYNYVGGETTYLSFEKAEYPMDAAGQREDILATNAHPASIMLWMETRLPVLERFIPETKSKPAIRASSVSWLRKNIRHRESEARSFAVSSISAKAMALRQESS